MQKALIAVDGSESSARAVEHALQRARGSREPLELHVLNVQPPVTFGDIGRFVSHEALNAYYHDEGTKALQRARALLGSLAPTPTFHIAVGPIAETIVEYAREHGCSQIIMGSRGLGSVSGLLLGSVAARVLHLVEVPVTLVK